MKGVIYVANSGNSKISGSKPIDSTYVSITASCPTSCALRKDGGCYAKMGRVGMHCRRLDAEAQHMSALDVAKAEAVAIDNAYNGGSIPKGRDLRLHVAGDSKTITGTRIINKAIGRWIERGGRSSFGYTHSWQYVPREAWCNASVLASIDSIDQTDKARARGYTPALVVAEHKSKKPYKLDGSDVTWIPCRQQIDGTNCSTCRLCANADKLYAANRGITFAAHGVCKNAIKRRLKLYDDSQAT